MAVVEPIKINGLRDLQAALRQMDGESQKQLRVVLNRAAELVIDKARPRVPVDSGAAKSSLKARSGQREAKVVGGGRKAPYYPWLDFGGKVGRNKSIERKFISSGRFIYPAYKSQQDEILKALEKGIVELAQGAGLEVS